MMLRTDGRNLPLEGLGEPALSRTRPTPRVPQTHPQGQGASPGQVIEFLDAHLVKYARLGNNSASDAMLARRASQVQRIRSFRQYHDESLRCIDVWAG
jgi:hypothetical protein